MRAYCEVCDREVESRIVFKKETYMVCGESVEVDAQVSVCDDCGEELFCERSDNATLVAAYDIYRKKHRLLLPEEIKQIREQYGLSQRGFSKLLNWGDKTIRRYENGSIQDRAHNSLLLFLRRPENMRTYLTENEIMLDDRQKEKLLAIVDDLEQSSKQHNARVVSMYFSVAPSIENGFRVFDYEKTCAMVLYFVHKSRELLKTKLMKLLNYSDMIFYQENGLSISGMRYVHLQYGPVPVSHDILFGMMEKDHVAHIEVVYDGKYEKHQVIADREIPGNVLSEKERNVLERVYDRFADFGSVEISEYSHREKGYSSTDLGEIISYVYAKDICLN